MKRLIASMVLAGSLLLSVPISALAASADPVAGCPDGFTLHQPHMMDDSMPMDHKHVGTSADQNGDGWVCMNMVTPSSKIHVHIDNNVPFK